MRANGAPEVRGFSSRGFGGAAAHAGVLAFLSMVLVAAPQRDGHSDPVAGSPVRRLTAPPSAALPGFTLPDLDGAPLRLDAHRGRVVLVHFFATWCEPCREELSSLSRLAQGPSGRRIAVVAVNVAEVPVRVRRFLEASPVGFPVVLDTDRAVTRSWRVSILPTTFVLDPALQPRLFVEGDLDWSRPDVVSALDALAAMLPKEIPTPSTPTGRNQ